MLRSFSSLNQYIMHGWNHVKDLVNTEQKASQKVAFKFFVLKLLFDRKHNKTWVQLHLKYEDSLCPSLLKSLAKPWLFLFAPPPVSFRCRHSWRKWGQSWKCRANTQHGWRAAAGRWNAHLASPVRDYRSAQDLLFTISCLVCFFSHHRFTICRKLKASLASS